MRNEEDRLGVRQDRLLGQERPHHDVLGQIWWNPEVKSGLEENEGLACVTKPREKLIHKTMCRSKMESLYSNEVVEELIQIHLGLTKRTHRL